MGCLSLFQQRHCEERSDEAIQILFRGTMDCFASLAKTAVGLSFRGDAKHRTTVRNCAPENLEIPGLVLRTIPE